MITKDEAQSCFRESDCVLRTPEEHFEECQKLTGLSNYPCSINSGIYRLSILEEIPEFSVVNGLPHDIMHDIFEGVAYYELKYILCYCFQEKLFTVTELNQRLNHFDLGGKDKPTSLDKARVVYTDKKIRQSAAQMMSLILSFPILIGDKIPEHNEHWYSILVLVKICQIVLSWRYSSTNCRRKVMPLE